MKTIKLDIYRTDIKVYVGAEEFQAFIKACKKEGDTEKVPKFEDLESDGFYFEDIMWIVSEKKTAENIGIVGHEVYHCVRALSRAKGAAEDEESMAYTTQFLLENIFS